MNNTVSATLENLDAEVSSKVREIIEQRWKKHIADLEDLTVGRFYERRIQDKIVSYLPTNRYVLRAKLRYVREARRVTFTIA